MIRFAKALLFAFSLAVLLNGQTGAGKPAGADNSATADKSAAYYNFAMGHLYAELAGVYGNRGEYVNKAIEHYKEALRLDPAARFLFEELTDLYIQAGKLRDAVTEAEEILRKSPDNLDARRILGRIYMRMIGDTQQGKINEEMLRRSTEQYQKITEKDPSDLESWLLLGQLYRVAHNSVEAEKAYSKALELDNDNEGALTGLAAVYSDVGDTKKAIEKLRALTDKNPNSRTLSALAGFHEQMRDYRSAAEVLKRALPLAPESARGRIRRALAQNLLFSEQYDEALKLYTEIAAEDPRDGQAHLRISEIYRQKREFEKARAALAKAKEADPESLEVRYAEVNLLESEGKNDQAITRLKEILEETARPSYTAAEKSNRAMLLERLGILHRNAGQYPEALAAFRQIGELDPQNGARVAVQMIETHRLARDLRAARAEAESAVQKYPKERMVRMVQASLLADLGQTDAAVASLRTLLNGERDRETHLALAQVYEKGKRYPDMARELDAAAKLSDSKDDQETVYFMRGAMYEKMKKYDAAESEFRKVLEISPDNASALNYLGYMLADRSLRLDEAQKLIQRALDLDPNNGAYLDSLGWVYYRLNRLPEAENLLLRALERIRTDPTIHDHLGDVYFKQGKTKDAITQWQASLKEWENSPQSEHDPAEVAKVQKKLESARVRLAKETGATK